MSRFKLIFLIFLIFPSFVWADIIYLKTGGSVTGKIVGQSRKSVRLRLDSGVIKVYQKSQVRRLRFRNEATVKKASELKRKQAAELKRKQAEAKQQKDEQNRKREEDRQQKEDTKKQESKDADKRRTQDTTMGPTWYWAFMRSLVVPGWGQYYQGRKTMGYTIGGVFYVALGSSVYLDRFYRNAHKNYTHDVETFLITSPLVISALGVSITDTAPFVLAGSLQTQTIATSRQQMEKAALHATTMRAIVAGVYIWNLVDVVLYHPSDKQSVWMRGRSDGLGFAYELRF